MDNPNSFLANDFNNRQDRVRDMQSDHTVGQMPNVIENLENTNERRREHKWKNTKDIIIACVTLKQLCGGQVGRWLNNQNHPNKNRITELCKWSAAVYKDWDEIVKILSKSEMRSVNVKDYNLRNLYDVRGKAWQKREEKRNVRQKKTVKDPPPEQQFDENIYQDILLNINDSTILEGVSHDHDQVDLFVERLREDMKKICDEAQ